jgi:hypothetical protein
MSRQAALSLVIGQDNINAFLIDLYVFGDNLDQLILKLVHFAGRKIDPVMDQYQLQAIFSDRPTFWFALSK